MKVYQNAVDIGYPVMSSICDYNPTKEPDAIIYGVEFRFPFLGSDGIVYSSLEQLCYNIECEVIEEGREQSKSN